MTDDLEQAIRAAWCPETIQRTDDQRIRQFHIEKHDATPSWGQCLVTALVVNEYLGGHVVQNGTQAHWFNELPSGEYLDLTHDQFDDDDSHECLPPVRRDRTALFLSIATLADRYELLKMRVEDELAKIPT